MAGHNKWSKVGRPKAVAGAKKGEVFSRFAKEIAVPVRPGAADFAARGGRLPHEPRPFAAVDEDGAGRSLLEELDYAVAVHGNHAV